jgi:hypothetical protein
MANTCSLPTDEALVNAVLGRVTRDLGMILGHDLSVENPRVERARSRPAGAGRIHISFKLGLRREGARQRHGALLVPLPEAVTMACFLLMIPDETVVARREETGLDSTLKDAMLEIANMVGGATSTALAEQGVAGWSVRSEGCQGVRADVRPAFPYEEGSELVVGRATARFESFQPFEMILMLPALG